MKVNEIIQKLDCKVIVESDINKEISSGFCGDLLSIVMSKAKENQVWVTIQSHVNIVAVASLVNISCIIVTEGFEIDNDAISKAKEEGINILSTKYSSFETIKYLIKIGL